MEVRAAESAAFWYTLNFSRGVEDEDAPPPLLSMRELLLSMVLEVQNQRENFDAMEMVHTLFSVTDKEGEKGGKRRK